MFNKDSICVDVWCRAVVTGGIHTVKSLTCTISGNSRQKAWENERRISQRQIIRCYFYAQKQEGTYGASRKMGCGGRGYNRFVLFRRVGGCAGYIPLAVILNYLTGRVTGFIEGGLNFIDR
ncbi:hypothetical protein B7C51_20690 [Paenibacillus larvae subsp. pulvifaciens]|uniref:Uncharacterized protein n=1 Tax=Paenibacillus larvae subsp. pulvifaciens TaxID=1477 RepID=A0A1V0UXB7_9BACL|nr:hypothetical protein B7C51_20690 [Paenibacillus larvae subsp. pulvifaciens]